MNKALRKVVIAGNWKMNKTPAEAKELISAIAPLVKDAGCEVIACTPFVDLASAQEAAEGTNIQIGAENCHWEKSGAYTGEISAEMLTAMGVKYRHHRPQRAPSVLWRDRCHRAEAGSCRSGRRHDRDPLRGRDPWSSGSRASPASWWPCRPRSLWAVSPRKS